MITNRQYEKKISVFTPTYNRAYILDRTYNCLKNQTFDDFEWVLIDDGSSDGTKELVQSWINEDVIDITYKYKENHGRFSAYNEACNLFKGELVVFLDSDDQFVEDALEKINNCWENIEDKEAVSGILGNMKKEDGQILGSDFPQKIKRERSYILYDKYGIKGDKLLVFKTDIAVRHRYKLYEYEKFGGDNIVFNAINDEFPMELLRDPVVIREYLPDSITNNLIKHHLASKNGMRDHYLDALKHEKYNQYNIFKHCIGYVAYSKMTGWRFKEIIANSPYKVRTVLFFVLGFFYQFRLLVVHN